MNGLLAVKVVTAASVVAGMVLLVLAAQRAAVLLALSAKTPFRRTWRILCGLMYVFAAFYVVCLGLVLVDASDAMSTIAGLILGGGGLFVYLVTRFSQMSLEALIDESSERRYTDEVLNALAEGILLVDGEGLVCGLNRRMSELCGADKGALIGTRAALLLGLAAESGGQSVGRVREGTLRRVKGPPIPVEVQYVELPGRDQESTGLIVVRDRREAHRREGELATAVKAAEAALRERHEFSRLIQGDVRPRLRALAEATEAGGDVSGAVRETVASLEEMLDGVVAPGYRSNGRGHVVQLRPLLDRVSSSLSRSAPKTSFHVNASADVPGRCLGRESSLREILSGIGRSLISSREPTDFCLSVERVPGDRERLLFVVGAAGEAVGGAELTDPGGALGLAAPRLLVQTFGGRLWVDQDDVSTKVSFTALLPEVAGGAEARVTTEDEMSPLMLIAAITARSSESMVAKNDSRGRALVVDDSPPARNLLAHLVRELGYVVEVASTGQACIDMATREPFDLVLLDLVLPDVNGIDIISVLREHKVSSGSSIVIVSSIEETRSVAACLERGADDYLVKPVNPIILRARLHGIHENRALARQASRQVTRLEQEIRRADGLLRAILPAPVARELQATGAVMTRRHPDVAVLFADVIGFTAYCEGRPPEQVLVELQVLVKEFESLCRRHGVLKVKTIGDALLACGGLMDDPTDATARIVKLGFSLLDATLRHPAGWGLRVGIHRGPVVAGIIGAQQFSYDIWGDTVNTASRIEHHGVAGGVCVSKAALSGVPEGYQARSVGVSDVKGKGPLEIFEVERPVEAEAAEISETHGRIDVDGPVRGPSSCY